MGCHTDVGKCPNCGEEMDAGMGHNLFHTVWGTCFNCGFTYDTVVKYLTLEELNQERDDRDLDAFKELPEQKEI